MYLTIIILLALLSVSIIWRLYQKSTNGVCRSNNKLIGKTAIVTGGTTGMGLEIAKDLAVRGAKVVIACPFENEGSDALKAITEETANANVKFKYLDLRSFASVRQFSSDIMSEENVIDILVNNAGGLFNYKTQDGLNGTMQVNYFGHFLLTMLLMPSLLKSKSCRIVNICSILHWLGKINLDNLEESGYLCLMMQPYHDSKLCVLHFSNELRKRVEGFNVTVNCVDPGAVGTNIFKKFGFIIGNAVTIFFKTFYKTPKEGAQSAIYASVDNNEEIIKGGYVKDCKIIKSFRAELDRDSASKFWDQSIKIVNLNTSEIFI